VRAIGIAILAVLFAVAATSFYRAASEPTGAMSPEDFARSTRLVASDAHEASLFVALLRGDRLTHAFAKTHREKLLESIRDESRSLRDPVPAELRAHAERVRALAAQAENIVADTQPREGDVDALRRYEGELAGIGDELGELAGIGDELGGLGAHP
jgi:hypothetical protein